MGGLRTLVAADDVVGNRGAGWGLTEDSGRMCGIPARAGSTPAGGKEGAISSLSVSLTANKNCCIKKINNQVDLPATDSVLAALEIEIALVSVTERWPLFFS